MEFYEVLDQVVALLQQRSRVTYRTLKREFQLDEERLDDLKEELLYAHPEVMDDEGRGLIWKEDRGNSLPALPTAHHPPVSRPTKAVTVPGSTVNVTPCNTSRSGT